jgi:hypothetical protein
MTTRCRVVILQMKKILNHSQRHRPLEATDQCPALWNNMPARLTPVDRLLDSGCPPAISGTVSIVVVDSVNRKLRTGPVTHIGKEFIEFKPSFANRNSPAAVIIKLLVPWVCASLNHCRPRHVNRGVSALCVTMFKKRAIYTFCLKTAAGFCFSLNQGVRPDYGFGLPFFVLCGGASEITLSLPKV